MANEPAAASTPAPTPVLTPAQTATQPAAAPLQQALTVTDNRPVEIIKHEAFQRMAKLFAASGLFADIKGTSEAQAIAQAYVKIALGDSMGFTPVESMSGIDIIQGKVAVSANLRAARLQRGGYSWDILELTEHGCRLRVRYKNTPLKQEVWDDQTQQYIEQDAIVEYSRDDAERAQLIGKDNWKKNPRDMMFARAITRVQRWYAPGVLSALSREEVLAGVEDDNDMRDVPRDTQDTRLQSKAAAGLAAIKEANREEEQPQQQQENPTELTTHEAAQSSVSRASEQEATTTEQASETTATLTEQAYQDPEEQTATQSRRSTKRGARAPHEQHGTPGIFE